MKKRILFSAILLLVAYAPLIGQQNKLNIPDTLSGNDIHLTLQKGTFPFFSGQLTETMGANGNLLGPTLMLKKHQQVKLNVKNELGEPTTMHWHGMHVAPENDGGPHSVIRNGETWAPSFEVLDHASTHWYHPHLHMKTHDHVQLGIAGFIYVTDEEERALTLPRTYGIDDIPLVLQSKAFDQNNQIIVAHTASDHTFMVNGTIDAYVDIPAQIVRLRLLNGASERVFNVGLSNNRSFQMIASDGGLLSAPLTMSRLLLAPGERAEILLNLSNLEGQEIQLVNYGSAIPMATYGATRPGMGQNQTIPGYAGNPLNGADFNMLQLNISQATMNPITTIPHALISHNPWAPSEANTTRQVTFTTMGGIMGPFLINGQHFDMDFINFRLPFENIEIWEIRNQTPIAHPFHIHNVPFYVLDINGNPPPAHHIGRKDVILVPGGNAVVRFITQFTDFHNDTIPYMFHCHMLTHEDDGMMGQFIVEAPCDAIKTQPVSTESRYEEQAQFTVETYNPQSSTYRWETNIGFGFQTIQDAGQYSGATTATLTISNLTSNNNNQLFRCIVNSDGCEMKTDVVTLSTFTSSKQIPTNSTFVFYPNPFKHAFTLKSGPESIGSTLQIFDAKGKRIHSQRIEDIETSIQLNNMKNGIYLGFIQSSHSNHTFKLIHQE